MKLKKFAASVVAAAMAVSLTACGVNVTGVDVPENIELAVGETAKLDVSFLGDEGAAQDKLDEAGAKLELVWASSDEEVVTVTDGELKAVAAGEAEVTVSANDGTLTDVCKVVVAIPVEGIEVPETLELVLGEKDSAEIGAKLLPEGATGATLTYVSSDEKIATVDENGKVTAVGAGECIITTIGTLEKSSDTIEEDTSAAVSEPVSENSENESSSSASSQASSAPEATAQPANNPQTVTGETKVTVTEPEQSANDSDNSNSGKTNSSKTNSSNTNSSKNNGSTATGGSSVSGGNGGSATSPSNNGGSTGGNTTPPAPTQPDPTPAPAPDPTPAPAPDPTPAPAPDPTPAPQPDPAPVDPPIDDGTVIPGGGSDENNGGDATAGERPLPPA